MKNGPSTDYWRLTIWGKQHIVANLQFSDFTQLCSEMNLTSNTEFREVLKGKVYVAYEMYIANEDDVKIRVLARASRHDICRNVSDFLDIHQGIKESRRIYTPADPMDEPPQTLRGIPRPPATRHHVG